MSQLTTTGKGFALQPATMQEALDLAGFLSGSQMVPKQYQKKPEDTLVAMMMGSELGLNPIQALQNIAVINGRPSIYGDALLALVQNHPAFVSIDEYFDDNSMTATCTVVRKGGKAHAVSFSKVDAEQAKLWGKPGPWSQYPKRMLQMRARGFALRNQFADALGGLISVEEAQDTPADAKVINPTHEAQPQAQAVIDQSGYSSEDFEKNLPTWKKAIDSGKFSADQIIAKVETKARLTEAQKQIILGA